MMYVKYALKAAIVLLAKALAMLFSPFIAMGVDKDANILPILAWAVTHDAKLDAGWRDNYWPKFKAWVGQARYDKRGFWRWVFRVMWICRNAGYGTAHRLGYDQRGMSVTPPARNEVYWDSGYPFKMHYRAVNARKQKGFMYQRQVYFSFMGQVCIEIYLGYKFFRTDPDERCMLVVRCWPKRYEINPDLPPPTKS